MSKITTKDKLGVLIGTLARSWLLPDTDVIRVMLAGVVAHRFQSDPLWIFLIAPPSSLKTELIASLDDLKEVNQISSLTPNTLFSGLKKTKNQKESNSLLETMGDKVITLKDFTTVLSMRHEDRSVVLSQLREIYDGKFSANYGSGVKIKWKGRVGLVAGVTPIIDIHYSVFQLLGERFIQYRLNQVDETELAAHAISDLGDETDTRKNARKVIKAFMDGLDVPPITEIKIPDNIKICIGNLASFVVRARSGVVRDSYRKTMEYVPEPEAPARLAKQLATLACSLAALEGRKKVNIDDYLLVLKVGLDCVPRQRMVVLEFMAGEDRTYKTREVADGIAYSKLGAIRHLEDLVAHKLLTADKEGFADLWEYSPRLKKYLKKMNPLNRKTKFKPKKPYKKILSYILLLPPSPGLIKNKENKPVYLGGTQGMWFPGTNDKKGDNLSRLKISELNKKKDFTEKWLKNNEGNSKYPAVLKHYQEILDAISLKGN